MKNSFDSELININGPRPVFRDTEPHSLATLWSGAREWGGATGVVQGSGVVQLEWCKGVEWCNWSGAREWSFVRNYNNGKINIFLLIAKKGDNNQKKK